MFQAILRTQWKWSWHAVALGVVAAFALPLISVQPTGAQSNYIFQTVDIMSEMSRYSPWFGGLALGEIYTEVGKTRLRQRLFRDEGQEMPPGF